MIHLLKLSDEHLAVINEALMLAPYGRVAPVIAAINEQLRPAPRPIPREREEPDSHGPHLAVA